MNDVRSAAMPTRGPVFTLPASGVIRFPASVGDLDRALTGGQITSRLSRSGAP